MQAWAGRISMEQVRGGAALSSWIKIGPHGTFEENGLLRTDRAMIDRSLNQAKLTNSRLLLHFHGGLVDEASGLETAERMGTNYGSVTRSLGLVWETGVYETFSQNIKDITSTEVFKKSLSWIIAKTLPFLGSDGGARGNFQLTDAHQIEAQLDNDEDVVRLDQTLVAETNGDTAARQRGGAASTDPVEDDLAADLNYDTGDLRILLDSEAPGADPLNRQLKPDGGARGISITVGLFLARVIFKVIGRYRAGTHHDLLPTAVEELLRAAYLAEIGAYAWSEMKQKAADMWLDDGPLPGSTGHVGGYILRKLEELQAEKPDVILDLVGHSAGSIAICAMLDAIRLQGRKIRVRNIVFLAPAVRLDTFRNSITGFKDFSRFRIFTMTDVAEKQDRLVGAVYPRSLLFLVSGLFEDKPGTPLAGLARHLTGRTSTADASYDPLRSWLNQEARLIFAPSKENAADGMQTNALRHGDFDNEAKTLKSLLYLAGLTR